MTTLYFPILKAKPAEFEAMAHLSASTRAHITPVFDLDQPNISARSFINADTPLLDYVNQAATKIASCTPRQRVYVDASYWPSDGLVESGEPVLARLASMLAAHGRRVGVVVGMDRWDDPEYQESLKILALGENLEPPCLRLSADVLEDDVADADYFIAKLEEVAGALSIDPATCMVLIDLGDLTTSSVEEAAQSARRALNLLVRQNYRRFVIAGSSMPIMINDAVPQQNSTGMLLRKEMLVWRALLPDYLGLRFGDYGVRHPRASESIKNPHSNGKIRYTLANHFHVLRGHSRSQGNKGEQMWDLASQLVQSAQYMGANFSWGDRRIEECSRRLFKGAPGDWIAIDTNHHAHAVVAEVYEFERQLRTTREGIDTLQR